MHEQAVVKMISFWLKQYPDMTYTKARAWALEQVDEAEKGDV